MPHHLSTRYFREVKTPRKRFYELLLKGIKLTTRALLCNSNTYISPASLSSHMAVALILYSISCTYREDYISASGANALCSIVHYTAAFIERNSAAYSTWIYKMYS